MSIGGCVGGSELLPAYHFLNGRTKGSAILYFIILD